MARVLPDVARTERYLRAIGIMPWRLRVRQSEAVPPEALPEIDLASAGAHGVVVVAAREVLETPALRARLDAMLGAAGIARQRIVAIGADGDALAGDPPQAACYVAFGPTAARALGAVLPSAWRDAATIIVTATTPRDWARDGGTRGETWRALRPLRRLRARKS